MISKINYCVVLSFILVFIAQGLSAQTARQRHNYFGVYTGYGLAFVEDYKGNSEIGNIHSYGAAYEIPVAKRISLEIVAGLNSFSVEFNRNSKEEIWENNQKVLADVSNEFDYRIDQFEFGLLFNYMAMKNLFIYTGGTLEINTEATAKHYQKILTPGLKFFGHSNTRQSNVWLYQDYYAPMAVGGFNYEYPWFTSQNFVLLISMGLRVKINLIELFEEEFEYHYYYGEPPVPSLKGITAVSAWFSIKI